jgi:multidrug efflux system outer membrane protein
MSRRVRAGVAFVALGFAACAIGPAYERPEIATPPDYRGDLGSPEAASLANLPWWEVFEDPVLVELVVVAIEHNLDLVQATARVEQSRALLGAARAEFYPQIEYSGRAGRTRVPLTAEPGQDHSSFDTFFGAFSLAWEVDVWGRIRRSSEAARAELLASESLRRGVLLSLVSDVAATYFELLGLDRELVIAQQARDAFEATLNLFTLRFQAGVGSKLQTTRAEASLADAEAVIPELESRLVSTENRLNVLLARSPGAVSRGKPLLEQVTPPRTPPGLPAQLLDRRPDIVQAEEEIVAANARVGVAMGNFLPRIGLTALYGGSSSDLKDLVTGSANLWNLLGEVAGPIFQGGLRLSQYRAQKAAWQQSKARYEQTVLNALAEVSDALVAQEKLAAERTRRERQVGALRESVDLALVRYGQGLASYYEVIDAQQELFPAERLLAQVQRAQLDTIVRLYRALGGGWTLDASWLPTP